MDNFEKRHLIEALRSGVPARSVGKYFSSSRSELLNKISSTLDSVKENGSDSMILSGKYGEGKTHMLNTIFEMAEEKNMVVSFISLGKETPLNNINVVYKSVIANTYLPGDSEPNALSLLSKLSSGSEKASDMYIYSARKLKSDRLYFVLKALLESEGTNDNDVDILEADLKGSFATQQLIKSLYFKFCKEKAQIRGKFSAKNNIIDYFCFFSHLFKTMGYNGWVILFDEAELIGRFSSSSRENAYLVMKQFLTPPEALENTLSVFAFSTSFNDEIIAGKNEYSSVALGKKSDEDKASIKEVLDRITTAEELKPLSPEELRNSISLIIKLYADAYGKPHDFNEEDVINIALSSGYLLRTKIRAATEALDQIYQYGDVGDIRAGNVQGENFSETLDDILSL